MNYLPKGYHNVSPYLRMRNASTAIDFYKNVFAATELSRMTMPDGKVGHAELMIGDSLIMLSDEFPEMGVKGPETLAGTTVGMLLYVENVDEVVAKASAAGAKIVNPVTDQFYGDRSGKIVDPYGHEWMIATHIEDVSPEEMKIREAAFYKQMGGA